ncbi:MAG: sulfatase [Rikenellaceae bacterium]
MKNHNSAIVLSALSLVSIYSCQEAPVPERMNVLFIPIDDLRPVELACYGGGAIIAPAMDELASRGTVFTRAYCQQAVSGPSRASVLTGLRPDQTKVWDLKTDFRDYLPDAVTLPQYFKESGYTTIGYGKTFHNNLPDTISWSEKRHIEGFPFDPDATYVNKENNDIVAKKIERFKERGIDRRDQLGIWYVKANSVECEDVEDDAYYDGVQTDAAVEALKELAEAGDPFFLAVGYYRPHLPYNAPKKYWDLYEREELQLPENRTPAEGAPEYALGNSYEMRGYDDQSKLPFSYGEQIDDQTIRELIHGYYASASYVDAQIGKLIKALDENGLSDNTIIVLWADHGFKLGEYNTCCKQSNYEIDTRVPLIVVDPRQKNKGVKQSSLVELVDLYPSVADLAGLPIPEGLAGESFKAILGDETAIDKEYAYSQFLRGRFGADTKKGVEQMGYAVRSDNFRYVEWYSWNMGEDTLGKYLTAELYDHRNDPLETINIADDPQYAEIVATHHEALAKFL